MQAVKYWSLHIVAIPFRIRSGIVVLSFFISLILYSLLFSIVHNGAVLMLSVIIACWLLKYYGLLTSLIFIPFGIIIVNYWFFPTTLNSNLLLIIITSTLITITIGFFVCALRTAFDTIQDSQQKVIQANQEKLLAYERQHEAQEAERRIAQAYEQQQQLNQQKDLFLAHVNHELCTPLVTVMGYLELLLAYSERIDEEKKASYIRKALTSAQDLNQQVANLLDAAQFSSTSSTPVYEKIVLSEVVQEVLASWNPHDLEDFTFQVNIPVGMTAWADPRFVSHILRNLLSNACKYAPRRTAIRIQALSHESSEVCLSVKDEGRGIPPSQVDLLFEKFVRLPQDRTGSVRGTGLGLYICKQFVEALGGRIWVESSGQTGDGSCFYFTLPIAQPAAMPV